MFTGMNEQIKIFENPQFGKIRTSGTSDEPLFCLADVCKVLEINNPSDAKRRLKQDGVVLIEVGVKTGVKTDGTPVYQTVKAMFVNEQNLYRVIMRSDKPQAEPFQDWVCGEVLPSIRKHGGYIASTPDDTPEVIMARALKIADETIRKREQELAAAKQQLSVAEHTVEVQDRKLNEQKPKVEFYDAVTESEGSESFEVVAKSIKSEVLGVPRFGRNTLTKILREMKIIFGTGRQIRPYQKYIDLKYFELVNYPYIKNRRAYMGWQTLVTQLGKQFIVKTLKRYFYDKEQQTQGKQLVLFSNNQ
jgi:Prophage antirepressor